MTVYIDNARIPYRRMIMCHMISDDIGELFEMAQNIGMRAEWFQPRSFPHFDVCAMRKKHALELGVTEVSKRELVQRMRQYRHRLEIDEQEKRRLVLLTRRPHFL